MRGWEHDCAAIHHAQATGVHAHCHEDGRCAAHLPCLRRYRSVGLITQAAKDRPISHRYVVTRKRKGRSHRSAVR